MVTQVVSLDIFLVSLIVLLVILLVLLILCWMLRRSKGRNLTELRITAEKSPHTLTIKTEPDRAHQLLDQLLDRVFLHIKPGSESGGQLQLEAGEELGSEHGPDSGPESGGQPQLEPGEERGSEHGPDSGPESGGEVSLQRKVISSTSTISPSRSPPHLPPQDLTHGLKRQ
ncbi:hypothetical protein Q8A73_006001 [Channa argus]|nr:hypothetical protein Q8A73_006001 [Channa argus]